MELCPVNTGGVMVVWLVVSSSVVGGGFYCSGSVQPHMSHHQSYQWSSLV